MDDRQLALSLAGLRPFLCDASVPEALTCGQLLQRRAKAVEDLYKAYKVGRWTPFS